MKTINNAFIAGFMTLAVVFTISSCQKGFDAKSYAPTKPLPKFDGYGSSKDIVPESLVAYWPFNGNLTDSLSATTGVATGTSFSTGVEGQGLQGADNAYVVTNIPAAVKALHSFTISTWVKMPLNTGATGIVSVAHNANFWGNFDIFYDNGGSATTGVLKVHVFNNAAKLDAPGGGVNAWEGGYTVVNPWNVWTQIAVTYNDATSTVNVYFNGKSVGTNTAAGFAPLDWSAATKMVFGTLQFQTTPSLTTNTGAQGWASFVNGQIDQIRVYNSPLTASQLDALYNLEKAGR
jgi:hypothetical protein